MAGVSVSWAWPADLGSGNWASAALSAVDAAGGGGGGERGTRHTAGMCIMPLDFLRACACVSVTGACIVTLYWDFHGTSAEGWLTLWLLVSSLVLMSRIRSAELVSTHRLLTGLCVFACAGAAPATTTATSSACDDVKGVFVAGTDTAKTDTAKWTKCPGDKVGCCQSWAGWVCVR